MFANLFSRIASAEVEVHIITNVASLPGTIHRSQFIAYQVVMPQWVDQLDFSSNLRFFLKASHLFLKLRKRVEFDILQIVGSLPLLGLYAAFLAHVGGCKSIWGFLNLPLRRGELNGLRQKLHSHPSWYRSLFYSRAAFWLLARLWSRWLDGIMVASQISSAFLRDLGVDERKIFLVPPGVDLEVFQPLRETKQPPYQILYASTCYPWKGIFDLLEAFTMVLDRGFSAHLLYVFSTARSESKAGETFIVQLEQRIAALGLTDRVTIREGPLNDIESIIARADLLTCPIQSAVQTLDVPMSALEAMACGLPVIGSRLGGIPEAITDGVNGFLVEPSAPEALAGAIMQMLGDPERMKTMGEESRRLVKRFDLAESAARLLEMYTALAGEKSIQRKCSACPRSATGSSPLSR